MRQIYLPNGDAFEVTGEGFAPIGQVLIAGTDHCAGLITVGLDCAGVDSMYKADLHHSDSGWVWRGDPTDIALLTMAHKLGRNRETKLNLYPQVNEIPFEPEHQFAATYHPIADQIHMLVKGAPERLLKMCGPQPGAPSPWAIAQQLTEQGYRVLALVEGVAPADLDPTKVPPEPSNLTLLGFVGMIAPLRSGVKSAIAACHTAGIAVWMVTGDHPATALAIARDLGLAANASRVVTGQVLEGRWSPTERQSLPQDIQYLIQTTCVFARIAPHQKLQLVNAARESGYFVAVTGDDVNDAPALRAANIGVAMGKAGIDVAREAAELVLSDANFATVVEAHLCILHCRSLLSIHI